jgi:hypothetical protein
MKEILQFTKEEAISVIKTNYLFMYFGCPEDTVANINRLIDNINQVVPVDEGKGNEIKEGILSEMKRTDRKKSAYDAFVDVEGALTLNTYNLPGFIPVMGINANDIIKNCFDASDYEKIHDRLMKDRIKGRNAFLHLRMLYNEGRRPEDLLMMNGADPKPCLDTVFNFHRILD